MSLCSDDAPNLLQMLSLWGSFNEESEGGFEKRFEVDVTPPSLLQSVSDDAWQKVLISVGCGCKLEDHGHMRCAVSSDCSIVICPGKVIVTTSPRVALNALTDQLLDVVRQNGMRVEWASFMRKNTSSPWSSGTGMGAEYAVLKNVFPQGNAYLFGPVDCSHYFYFIYDAVDRQSGTPETDVQINVVMYDIKEVAKATQSYCSLGKPGEYEVLRVFPHTESTWCATFETTSTSCKYSDAINELLEKYSPGRFTVIVLADPQSTLNACFAANNFCGLEDFEQYEVVNTTRNEFQHGYVVHKSSFVHV